MNDDKSHLNDDRSTDDTDQSAFERRVTVPEAAEILGISPEAVRARMNRGTLKREKGADGTAYVCLNDDQMRSNGVHTNSPNDDHARSNDDHTEKQETNVKDSLVFELMQEQINFMRSELERKDTIIMSLVQRVPELEPVAEPRESPVKASEEEGNTSPAPEAERHSWWRWLLGD